jgi:molybdate transport system substrate-binding protein
MSLAKAPPMRDKGRYIDVPADSYPRLDQAGVILASAQDKHIAATFLNFMASAQGKAVLRRYGFVIPDD